jgi:hypothetical protein
MKYIIQAIFLIFTLGLQAQDLDLIVPSVSRVNDLEKLDDGVYFNSSTVRYLFDDRGVEIIGIAFLDTSEVVYIYFLFKNPIYLHGNKYRFGKEKPKDLNDLATKVKWRRIDRIRVIGV